MNDEKKIFIDDDWKSQVAAEKEALKQEVQQPESGSASSPEATGDGATSGGKCHLPRWNCCFQRLPPKRWSLWASFLTLRRSRCLSTRSMPDMRLICWKCCRRKPRAISSLVRKSYSLICCTSSGCYL